MASQADPVAVVIGIAPSGAGGPRWWASDGALFALRYCGRLGRLCADAAREQPPPRAAGHRGRGATPALPARLARLPAIAIGCLDDRGLAPRSHQPSDRAELIDPGALERAVEFTLLLVDRIDASLADDSA
jgi:hypothetical protein